jgi:hypothetical protein
VSTLVAVSVSGGVSYRPALGDFDGDGTLDFVGVAGGTGTMAVLLGEGDGTFRPRAIASSLVETWQAEAADLNEDGRLDLAITQEKKPAVVVRLGNGDPSLFGPGTDYPTSSLPRSLIADLDDDGHLDLLAAEWNLLTVWRGAGGGQFGEPVRFPLGSASDALLVATDWNRDGVLDLLFGSYTLRILQGRGDGSFEKEIACGLALDRSSSNRNVLGDFDHDQKVDVVVPMSGIVLGMNGCNFSTWAPMPEPNRDMGGPVAAADLNGDGNLDVVTSVELLEGTVDSRIAVALGDGRGGFTPPTTFPGPRGLATLLMADLDHDGKLDILATGYGAWRVLLNTCP